jgi:serine O-acetyltransferase
MEMAVTEDELLQLVMHQLRSFFPVNDSESQAVAKALPVALNRCWTCFQLADNKYFKTEFGEVKFTPYHSVQYMIFLYYLSNTIYKLSPSSPLCDKIYYLNKIMHSVDILYAVELPDLFSAEHPLGSVMGRARYGNGFIFYQGCTVGGSCRKDENGHYYYPVIEENVRMYSNSSILGKCHIGKNVWIGAGALIKNQDVPDNSIVFGQSPHLIIKHNDRI